MHKTPRACIADERPCVRADLCLSPSGRGESEVVVSVPNEFLERIPAPDIDDTHSLEQIVEGNITAKCAPLSRGFQTSKHPRKRDCSRGAAEPLLCATHMHMCGFRAQGYCVRCCSVQRSAPASEIPDLHLCT